MKNLFVLIGLIIIFHQTAVAQHVKSGQLQASNQFPSSSENQVTFSSYREHPFSQWSFRNAGAPMHVLMIPRAGAVHVFGESPDGAIAKTISTDTQGNSKTFEAMFSDNYADGVVVIRGNNILYEKYWNGLSRDYQHIWFSCSKSLASAAFGILVEEKKVDLSASPAKYIPELKGTPFERPTIQDVLNMATALGYADNYVDTTSFYYANSRYILGGREPKPGAPEELGVYDFLVKRAYSNPALDPGVKFEYNSANVDVISWLITRLSGRPYHEFIREKIWAKLGVEHDAYITTDRTYTGVATGGINSTLRDAALFGQLMLNRGSINGVKIIPQNWVDQLLNLTNVDKERYGRNDVYVNAKMPWIGYKNYWWILDTEKGEYAAVGIHGQVIYINRSAKMVIAYFSSQPQGSSVAGFHPFVSKLNACRELAKTYPKR